MEKMTIVIPTRDRADVLRYCIQATLSLKYENLVVLVSDNASIDDTAEVVKSFRDDRLTYIRTPKRVSMSTNWEFALSHVKDGWVTVIGDDDAVLPGAIERVMEIAKETGVSAVRSSTCVYQWPGTFHTDFGRLSVPLRTGFKVLDTGKMLQAVLDGHEHYPRLPMLYNGGFVRIDCIKEIAALADRFFLSPTPDVYSAVALCAKLDKYAFSTEPLAINGASIHSGGTAAFSPKRIAGELHTKPAEMFMKEIDFPFHRSVPLLADGKFPPSIQAVVYEAFQQARQVFPFDNIRVHAESQLQLILAEAAQAGRTETLKTWAPSFLVANGIEAVDCPNLQSWAKIRMARRLMQQRLSNLDIYTFQCSARVPITDVNQACVTAEALKKKGFNRYVNWSRQIMHFLYRRAFRKQAQ